MNALSPRGQAWLDSGFSIWQAPGAFIPSIAPFFFRVSDADLVFRVEVGAQHCNGAGTAHGGFLATIADVVLGYNINHRIPKEWRIATSNLSVQFLAPTLPGQWVEGKLDRVKIGKRLCHASGTLDVEGVSIVTMHAIFAVVSGDPAPSFGSVR